MLVTQHLHRFPLFVLVALLSSACGSGSGGTDVGAVRVRAIVAAAGGPTITRVHLAVTPHGSSGDLVPDAGTGEYSGTFTVIAGAKTVTATAYAGEDAVGSAAVDITVEQHRTAAVAITILDATTRPAGADHGPILSSVVASDAAPEANDAITLTATAVDPDGHAITYGWTDSCGGVFEDAGAASTTWHNADAEGCTITARATANGLSHELSVAVTTQAPTGHLEVAVEFIPAPYVASLSLTGGPFSPCTVARTDLDASCRPAIATGTALAASVTYDPLPADSGATVALTSSCGGLTAAPVVDLAGGSASFTWTAPGLAATCLVTATVTRDGLVDAVTVGLNVVAP